MTGNESKTIPRAYEFDPTLSFSSAAARTVLDVWQDECGRNRLPAGDPVIDTALAAAPDLICWGTLCEDERGQFDAIIRYMGAVASTIYDLAEGERLSDSLDTHLAVRRRAILSTVADEGVVTRVLIWRPKEDGTGSHHLELGIFPLAKDGTKTDRILMIWGIL